MKLYHGNIVFSKSRDELAEYRNSYIAVADDGTVEGIYPEIPEKYAGVLTEDVRIFKKYDGYAVTCPDATVNVIAGIMQTGAFLLHTFRIYVIIYFADSLVAYMDWDCENQIETNEAGRERKHFSASFFKEEGWR